MELASTSRFKWSPLYNINGVLRFGLRRRVTLVKNDTYILHIVSGGDDSAERLESISEKYYGTGYYWWVLADVNQVTVPWEIVAGQSLRIPTRETLGRLVNQQPKE